MVFLLLTCDKHWIADKQIADVVNIQSELLRDLVLLGSGEITKLLKALFANTFDGALFVVALFSVSQDILDVFR